MSPVARLTEVELSNVGPLRESLMSRRKTERFCVNLCRHERKREREGRRESDGVRVSEGDEPISVLRQEIPFNAVHQVVEPLSHRGLDVDCLRLDDLSSKASEVLFVQEDQPEQRTRHGPLVATVFEHNDVEDGREHLLQDLGMHLQDLEAGFPLATAVAADRLFHFVALGNPLEQVCHNVIQGCAAAGAHHGVQSRQSL